jgi:uncharacterized protein
MEEMIKFILMAQSEVLVVMAKKPDAWKTKTRLSPQLNAGDAADLYTCFLSDTLVEAASVGGVDHLIFYDPPQARQFFLDLTSEFQFLEQQGTGLGERMHQAFSILLSSGYQRMVLIGSDLPHIPAYTYQQGFKALRQGADLVLGPCADGGYFLIGLRRPESELFRIQMSTPFVLQQTVERARSSGLRVSLLPENFDVDTFSDLLHLIKHLVSNPEIQASHTRAWMVAHSFIPESQK